jgi:hypothetical protein
MRTDDERRDYDDHPERTRKPASAVPLVLLVSLAALAGLAVVGCFAYLFIGWAARPAAGPAVVAPGAPVPGPGKGGMMMVEGGPQWTTVESDEFAFRAEFPHGEPQPFNPFADSPDPKDQAAAELLMKNVRGKYLQTTAGGRRYALVVTPLDLAGLPARQYLRANAGNMGRMYKGWTSEPGPEWESAGHPYQDFTLRKDGRVKLLRMVVVPGFTYSLTVGQVGDVTLADPMVTAFFERFTSAVPVPAKGK